MYFKDPLPKSLIECVGNILRGETPKQLDEGLILKSVSKTFQANDGKKSFFFTVQSDGSLVISIQAGKAGEPRTEGSDIKIPKAKVDKFMKALNSHYESRK